jgi:hypothetical protein
MTNETPTPSEQSKAMADMFQKMATYGGGPAHPMQVEVGKTESGEPTIWFSMGMTKRERFAMAAMQGWLASYGDNRQFPLDAEQEDLAARCCQMADALLERLKK